MDKYVKLSDIQNPKIYTNELEGLAKPMVAVSDIEKLILIAGRDDTVHALCKLVVGLKKLYNPQPEKYGGLSVEEVDTLKRIVGKIEYEG